MAAGPLKESGVKPFNVAFVGFALQNLWWRTLQFASCNAADPVTNTLFLLFLCGPFNYFPTCGRWWDMTNPKPPLFFFGTMATILQAKSQLIDWVVDWGLLLSMAILYLFLLLTYIHITYWLKDTLQMMSKT
jgi:hypothetical protein